MNILIIGGAGKVGSTLAYSLLIHNLNIQEIVLYDIASSVNAYAEELQQVALWLWVPTRVTANTNLSNAAPCDIVVICSGVSLQSLQTTNRDDLLIANKKMIEDIFVCLVYNRKTIFIVVSNPVDAITYFVTQQKDIDRDRVLGLSTYTDSIRLQTIQDWWIFGTHARDMIAYQEYGDMNAIIQMGINTVQAKWWTWFLTASLVLSIIVAILKDEQRFFPVSTLLMGEFACQNICLSVPCIIGKNGITKRLEDIYPNLDTFLSSISQ